MALNYHFHNITGEIMDSSVAYAALDKAWKSTCRVVLGEPIGDLNDYKDYLMKYVEPSFEKKSIISGKKVTVSSPKFCKTARFISNDERQKYIDSTKNMKLDINQIKDIDSLIDSLSEKFIYSGNQWIGKCSGVVESHKCIDSHQIYHCVDIYNCKHMVYSSMLRYCDYVFGSNWGSLSKFIISSFEIFNQTRCMETLDVWNSQDCYFCATLENCNDCLFSFNLKNKRNLIGNLEFPRDEYLKNKQKLLSDIRDRLVKDRKIPSIIDILGENNV